MLEPHSTTAPNPPLMPYFTKSSLSALMPALSQAIPKVSLRRCGGARCEPKQTYLMGDLYVQEEALPAEVADWKAALKQLQFGGERGYGWGRVCLVACEAIERCDSEPIVTIKANQPIKAHAHATDSHA